MKILNFETWTKSEATSAAAGWERKAFWWGRQSSSSDFGRRMNLSDEMIDRQIQICAEMAITWYLRARKAVK